MRERSFCSVFSLSLASDGEIPVGIGDSGSSLASASGASPMGCVRLLHSITGLAGDRTGLYSTALTDHACGGDVRRGVPRSSIALRFASRDVGRSRGLLIDDGCIVAASFVSSSEAQLSLWPVPGTACNTAGCNAMSAGAALGPGLPKGNNKLHLLWASGP